MIISKFKMILLRGEVILKLKSLSKFKILFIYTSKGSDVTNLNIGGPSSSS